MEDTTWLKMETLESVGSNVERLCSKMEAPVKRDSLLKEGSTPEDPAILPEEAGTTYKFQVIHSP